MNPLAAASSAVATSSRVLPIPGSPSSVTAARRPDASRSSWPIASSSALRPTTSPVARRKCTASEHCGPTTGSRAPPSAAHAIGGDARPSARGLELIRVFLERLADLARGSIRDGCAQLAAADGERRGVPQPLLHEDPGRRLVRQQVVDLVEELEAGAGGDARAGAARRATW